MKSQIRRAGLVWPAVSLLVLLAAACSSSDGPATTTPEDPPPTAFVVERLNAMSGELDLSYLPDDPTELMMDTFTEVLDLVARKVAYSGNQPYIPVLLELLRFQAQHEPIAQMTSLLSPVNENLTPGEVNIIPQEKKEWN